MALLEHSIKTDPNLKNPEISQKQRVHYEAQLKKNFSNNIVTMFCLYIMYDDKKSVMDHVKLHKMHHYNIKFEETQREVLDNFPQVLTIPFLFDDETIYYGHKYLGIDWKVVEEDRKFLKFILQYIKENHFQHYV